MMVLEKTLPRFNIWKWMTLLTGLCRSVGELCLRSLIWKVPTALLPYTLMIFLACSGKEITLCTSPYLLVCLQRLTFFLQLRTWWIGFSKKQYDVSFLLHYLDDFHTLGPPNQYPVSSIQYPAIPGLGDSPSPWQVGEPFHYPDCFRHRALLSPIARAPRARKIWLYQHTPGLLVTKTPLHTEGAGVFNWQSSTCMQSRPFWSQLPPPYDQSAFTFLQREPSYKA